MVYLAPLNPDSYRDNEKHVDNFADHLREKAAIEQRNIVDITTEEMHRFKDVMFGVNTQHSGAQLRLRDDHGKVISKLKESAQLKIVGNHHATIDDDGAAGNPDEHIWVEVEVDAAQTEAGGNGKIRGWVSTEYINAMGQPAPLDPVLDNPNSWGEDVPKPPEPGLGKPEEPKNDQVPPITPKPEEPKNDQVPPITPKPEEPKNDQVPPPPTTTPETPQPVSTDPEKATDSDSSTAKTTPTAPEKEVTLSPEKTDIKEPTKTENPSDSLSGASTWKSIFKKWFPSFFSIETKDTVRTVESEKDSDSTKIAPEQTKKVVTNPVE